MRAHVYPLLCWKRLAAELSTHGVNFAAAGTYFGMLYLDSYVADQLFLKLDNSTWYESNRGKQMKWELLSRCVVLSDCRGLLTLLARPHAAISIASRDVNET